MTIKEIKETSEGGVANSQQVSVGVMSRSRNRKCEGFEENGCLECLGGGVYSDTQLCPTLCNPMYCSLPDFSFHGILQARILDWVSISSTRRASQFRD